MQHEHRHWREDVAYSSAHFSVSGQVRPRPVLSSDDAVAYRYADGALAERRLEGRLDWQARVAQSAIWSRECSVSSQDGGERKRNRTSVRKDRHQGMARTRVSFRRLRVFHAGQNQVPQGGRDKRGGGATAPSNLVAYSKRDTEAIMNSGLEGWLLR